MLATALAEQNRTNQTGQSELHPDAGEETLVQRALRGKPTMARERKRGHEPRQVEMVGGVKRRQRKAWKPSGRDELIYQWVRFEGKTQDFAARAYDISQATVSRILQRYEKWQSHAQPGADGSLTHAERQRMQWWLTYERNERILASSLRMAGDMEFPRDAEKSVTVRPGLPTSGGREIRTEYSVLDRSGMAARFLRLAFRINMEQLKLVEREPEALEPLTEEVLTAQEAEEAAVEAEIKQSRQQREENEAMRHRIDSEVSAAVAAEVKRLLGSWPADGTPERKEAADETRMDADRAEGSTDEEVPSDQTLPLKLHKVHNGMAAESGASADATCGCDEIRATEKSVDNACIDVPRGGRAGVISEANSCPPGQEWSEQVASIAPN